MADNNTPAPDLSQEDKNKQVAADLANQGADHLPTPEDHAAAGDALDALAKGVIEKKENPPEPAAAAAVVKEPTAEEKAAAEAKAKIDAELSAAAEKIFKDSPGLPPNASPKSAESFAAIKTKAAQDIVQRDAEIERLKKENAELTERTKQPIPDSVTKELEDHRNWRAKLDVDADPKFKAFDKTVEEAREFVYAQLKKSPVVTPAILDEIKKYGGPDKVNLSKLFEAIKDPTIQRLVESKVADIEQAHYNKEQAIKATKDNISQYLEERTKQTQAAMTQHNTATKARVQELSTALEWLKPKTAEANADDAAKKSVEEHNAFIADTQNQLAAALQDDSAEMRAILLIGMAQLFNLQREHKISTDRLATTEKELKETKEKWEKVKNSSISRLRESGATTTAAVQKPKSIAEQTTLSAGDALDAIAKQVMEKKTAVAA